MITLSQRAQMTNRLPYPPLTAGSDGMAGYRETNWSPCTSGWAEHAKTRK